MRGTLLAHQEDRESSIFHIRTYAMDIGMSVGFTHDAGTAPVPGLPVTHQIAQHILTYNLISDA